MDLNIKKEKDGTLIVEMKGVDAYLPNLLRHVLWEDETVTFAAFDKDHPYVGTPKLIIRGRNPEKSLKEAIKKVRERFEVLNELVQTKIK